jgi:hypothetical protein
MLAFAIMAILFIIFAFFAPSLLTSEAISNRFNYTGTGSIGETIGGLMGPFIALAGVCITFLAFFVQFRANQIQIASINKNQNEQAQASQRQIFFRSVGELNQKINNFSFDNNSGYKALDELISEFKNNIETQLVSLGRQLLAETPEKIPLIHYTRIADITPKYKPLNARELKEDIIKNNDDRWEYIKNYIGSTYAENPKQKEALEYIGMEQFYKIDFEKRQEIYETCYQKVYGKFSGFMDSYIKNFKYLISFVTIFYFCASRKCLNIFREKIKKIDLFANLDFPNCRFVDMPLEEEFDNEVKNVLNEMYYSDLSM